jgi:hypothetical protein
MAISNNTEQVIHMIKGLSGLNKIGKTTDTQQKAQLSSRSHHLTEKEAVTAATYAP